MTSDWHCHLLPGLDDGPRTIDESVAMAGALTRRGYTTVYCTPHLIKGFFEADNDAVRRGVAALQARLDEEYIKLKIFPGREYYLDEFLLDNLKNPLPLGETKYLLIEIPGHVPPDHVKETCYQIKINGFTPMIAHPERCQLLAPNFRDIDRKGFWGSLFNSKPKTQSSILEETSLIGYLREIGCKFQGNLGSFAGFYGVKVKRDAVMLKEAGIYTHFATDAHSVQGISALQEKNAVF